MTSPFSVIVSVILAGGFIDDPSKIEKPPPYPVPVILPVFPYPGDVLEPFRVEYV